MPLALRFALCTLHAHIVHAARTRQRWGMHALCVPCACFVMLGGLRGTGRVCIQAFRNDAMNDASQVALHDLEMERDGKGF